MVKCGNYSVFLGTLSIILIGEPLATVEGFEPRGALELLFNYLPPYLLLFYSTILFYVRGFRGLRGLARGLG